MNAIERACVAAGNATSLAKKLGVTISMVSNWKTRGAPAERCLDIERATDGAVTRYELRPDVFGPPPGVATADQQAAA